MEAVITPIRKKEITVAVRFDNFDQEQKLLENAFYACQILQDIRLLGNLMEACGGRKINHLSMSRLPWAIVSDNDCDSVDLTDYLEQLHYLESMSSHIVAVNPQLENFIIEHDIIMAGGKSRLALDRSVIENVGLLVSLEKTRDLFLAGKVSNKTYGHQLLRFAKIMNKK